LLLKRERSTKHGGGATAAAAALENFAPLLGGSARAESADATLLELRITNVDLHAVVLSTTEAHNKVRLNGMKSIYKPERMSTFCIELGTDSVIGDIKDA